VLTSGFNLDKGSPCGESVHKRKNIHLLQREQGGKGEKSKHWKALNVSEKSENNRI
jgi:hypothetical protein